MSNVTGNDIDDLFKRAAQGYPLRTNSSDWSRLAADLDKDPSMILPPVNPEEGGGRRRRLWWLLLLLPLGGLGYLAWHANGRPAAETAATTQAKGQKTDTEAGQKANTEGGQKTNIAIGQQQHTGNAADATEKGKDGAAEKGKADVTERDKAGAADGSRKVGRDADGRGAADGTSHASAHRKVDGIRDNDRNGGVHGDSDVQVTGAGRGTGDARVTGAGGGTGDTRGAGNVRGIGNSRVTGDGGSAGVARRTGHVGTTAGVGRGKHQRNAGEDSDADAQGNANGVGIAGGSVNANDAGDGGERSNAAGVGATGASSSRKKEPFQVSRAAWDKRYAVNVAVKAPAKAAPEKLEKKRPYFYVGLTAAPDLSTIKFQSVRGTGTTFGLILGYHFGNRWGIETGINLDRKKYYTSGEYYNKSKYEYLSYIDNLKVKGVCNMWEVPVNVRYDIADKGGVKWFATAGLSTYLMTGENYDFWGTHNGGQEWWASKNYNQASQYWFSIMNLSVGYERKLGSVGNLRLEPYIKVPLGGVGSGSLPIMSVGLNIGLTRRIW